MLKLLMINETYHLIKAVSSIINSLCELI